MVDLVLVYYLSHEARTRFTESLGDSGRSYHIRKPKLAGSSLNTEAPQMIKIIGLTASMVLVLALLRQAWRVAGGNAPRTVLLPPRR